MYNKIYKDYENRQFMGVCSGIADMLDVDVTIVRLITLIGMIAFIPGVIVYVILGFLLPDKNDIPINFRFHYPLGNGSGQKFYRSVYNRKIFGVAGGIADMYQIDPTIIRAVFCILALLDGFGLLLYFALALAIPEEKNEPIVKKDSNIL